MREMNRRDALRFASAGLGAAFSLGATRAASALETNESANPAMAEGVEAWKYVLVDPDKVARDAYYGYPVGHCMHSTFYSIVANVAEELSKTDPLAGAAMKSFPFHIFHYGASGANGWGSLCGSLNGALAAISLFCGAEKTRKALCDELGNYYEKTAFPIFVPDEEEPLVQTVSGSILCHVSVGKWAAEAKVRTDSPERTDRCSRLSADVAKRTVELLNLNVAQLGATEPKPVVFCARPEPTASCVKCHDKGGEESNIIGKMTCQECHPSKTVDNH